MTDEKETSPDDPMSIKDQLIEMRVMIERLAIAVESLQGAARFDAQMAAQTLARNERMRILRGNG